MIQKIPANNFHRLDKTDFIEIADIKRCHKADEVRAMEKHGLFRNQKIVGGAMCIRLIDYQRFCCLPFAGDKK